MSDPGSHVYTSGSHNLVCTKVTRSACFVPLSISRSCLHKFLIIQSEVELESAIYKHPSIILVKAILRPEFEKHCFEV